jgi:hypothetical protein
VPMDRVQAPDASPLSTGTLSTSGKDAPLLEPSVVTSQVCSDPC